MFFLGEMLMIYATDTVIGRSEFPFDMFEGSGQPESTPLDHLKLHNHNCLEINLCVHDGGCYLIGNQKYELHTGDICIINNQEYHMAVNRGGLLLKVIVFDPDLVWTGSRTDYLYLQAFFERKESNPPFLPAELPITKEITPILSEIEREWTEKKPGYQLLIKADLLKFLARIYRYYVEAESLMDGRQRSWQNHHSIVEAVDYINTHFSEPLSLGQMAEMVHMSQHYFSGVFSQVMHMPFSRYVLERRLTQAGMLLKTTDQSVTEIALATGFGTISYFNQMFKKKYGMTPGMYRKNYQGISQDNIPPLKTDKKTSFS